MTTYNEWLYRIEGLLDICKAFNTDGIATRLSRVDLIELKLIIETCEILAKKEEANNDKATN